MQAAFYNDPCAVAKSIMSTKGPIEGFEWLMDEPSGFSQLPTNRVQFSELDLIKEMIRLQLKDSDMLLTIASQYGRESVVKLLLEWLVKANDQALVFAAQYGHESVMRLLLNSVRADF